LTTVIYLAKRARSSEFDSWATNFTLYIFHLNLLHTILVFLLDCLRF